MAEDPDVLARLVHEQRLAHEADQAAKEGRARFHLGFWEDRTDAQRELDRRIASAVAARAVRDAGLRDDRRDAQLFALQAHLPAVLDALAYAAANLDAGGRAGRYKAALEALGGGEDTDA